MARASHSLASLMRTQTAAGDAHLRPELQELTRLNKIEIRKSKVLSAQLENHLDCFEAAYDAAEAACLQHPPTAPHPAPQPFDPARPYENDGFVSTLAFLALRATQTPEGQTAKIPEVQASSTLGVQAADTLGVQAASTLGVQAASTLGVQTCPEPPASGCAQGFNLLPPALPVSDPEDPQPTDAAPQSVLNAAAEPLPPIAAGGGAQHADDQDGIAAAANDAAAVEDDNSPAAKLRAAAIPSAHPDCKIPFACITCRKRPTCPSCPPAMRHKLPPNFPSSPSPAANPVDFLSPPFEGG
jgi:hypothetical protein